MQLEILLMDIISGQHKRADDGRHGLMLLIDV